LRCGTHLVRPPSFLVKPHTPKPPKFVLHGAGQDGYDRLRPLSYPDTHVVILCFSFQDPDTLENITEKYISEVLHFCSHIPYFLVGIRNPEHGAVDHVTSEEARKVAEQIKADMYLECTLRSGEGINEVFEHAARAALHRKKKLTLLQKLWRSVTTHGKGKEKAHDEHADQATVVEIFALVVFYSDGLLKLHAFETEKVKKKTKRFFAIAKQLPMELQMLLCHRVAGSNGFLVTIRDSEVAFRNLAKGYLTSSS